MDINEKRRLENEEKEKAHKSALESRRITDAKIDSLLASLHTTQQQYVYYILAITAACIGFTVSDTVNSVWDKSLLSGGIAVSMWILSFVFGVLQLTSIEKHIQFNMAQLVLFQHNAENKNIANAIGGINKKKNVFRKLQNVFLILGAICFLYWHVQTLINNQKNKNIFKVEITNPSKQK